MKKIPRTLKHWTDKEVSFLHLHHDKPMPYLISKLGRTEGAIRTKMFYNGLGNRTKVRVDPRQWSKTEISFLKLNNNKPMTHLISKLGRTENAIRIKYHHIGIAYRKKRGISESHLKLILKNIGKSTKKIIGNNRIVDKKNKLYFI